MFLTSPDTIIWSLLLTRHDTNKKSELDSALLKSIILNYTQIWTVISNPSWTSEARREMGGREGSFQSLYLIGSFFHELRDASNHIRGSDISFNVRNIGILTGISTPFSSYCSCCHNHLKITGLILRKTSLFTSSPALIIVLVFLSFDRRFVVSFSVQDQ